jgi:DNA-binding Xre family transcriptional regulator
MGRLSDAEALERLKAALEAMPPDLVEQVIQHARRAPGEWRAMTAADMVKRLRHRFDMTQRQLAALSGFPHAMVARIERGQDIRLSTLLQLFAGFGCSLVLLPVSALSAEALWRRPNDLGGMRFIPRKRRWSRR